MPESPISLVNKNFIQTFPERDLPHWGIQIPVAPLYYLLGVRSDLGLYTHPKIGASWEGYAIEDIVPPSAVTKSSILPVLFLTRLHFRVYNLIRFCAPPWAGAFLFNRAHHPFGWCAFLIPAPGGAA